MLFKALLAKYNVPLDIVCSLVEKCLYSWSALVGYLKKNADIMENLFKMKTF